MEPMKNTIATILFLFISVIAYAQGRSEDVLYLKDGSIYRGTIIEEIPGVSYKIEMVGGNVVFVQAKSVTKVERGKPVNAADDTRPASTSRGRPVKVKNPYYFYQDKGFYFQTQANVGVLMGLRLAAGYKFNRYASLGLGTGIELNLKVSTLVLDPSFDGHGGGTAAGYVPIFLHFTGDVIKGKVVPFYSAEVGYTFCITPSIQSGGEIYYYNNGPPSTAYNYHNPGGVFGGVGFGAKFYTAHRLNVMISLNCNYEYLPYTYTQNYPTGSGSGAWRDWLPGARLTLCF